MNIGDIVRVSEDSMHWELFQEFDMPPEGIVIDIGPDMEDEKYLVEFSRDEHFLHDGGRMDNAACRYWIEDLEVLEERPDVNEEFFAMEGAAIQEERVPGPARVADIPIPQPHFIVEEGDFVHGGRNERG